MRLTPDRASVLRRPVFFTKKSFWALLIILALTTAGFYPVHFLQIENPQTEKVFLVHCVSVKDRFSLSYKHSVELCRVSDRYLVDDRYRMVVYETAFGSSNTGLPSVLGQGEILLREENNYLISNMKRTFSHVDFWVNKAYENSLEFAGTNIRLPLLAGNSLLRLSLEKATFFEFAFKKIMTFYRTGKEMR
jgi:hypothetical protein